MKKLNKYIMLFVAALALVSCVDDGIDNPTLKAQAGDEVQFGLTLPSTRTVYGDQDGNAYPIYWVNEDKVFIFSPDCLDGRRGAEYKVSVSGTEQNYANSLTKTGDFGVQWGDNETADFYSLYPSGLYGLSDDGKIAKGIVVNTSQNIVITKDAEGKRIIKSDMEDCLLYAKKLGVQSGTTVELQYSPITTVFMLTLSVGDKSAEEYTIQSISLKAPEGTDIAGKFGINVADGTFAEWSETKDNIVSAAISDKSSGGFLTLTKGESVEVPLFFAPIRNENVDNGAFSVNGWTIEVKANGKTYSKTLGDLTVVPGQIHKITLPALSSNKAQEWDVATWMVNIPRNVYLSEITIPGTWNSLNSDCQSDTSINTQYTNGVRAFHIDTRWKATRNGTVGQIVRPTINELSVCDGSTSYSVLGDDGRVNGTDAPTFASCLKTITDNVKEDEYMVVFCTFANDSYKGDRCPSTWYKAVSDACAANDKVIDASTLTQNSVVGDVLNRVIVVVNIDESINSDNLPSGSRCLFTYVPLNLPNNHYGGVSEGDAYMATADGHIDALYYGSGSMSRISMYTSHAQLSSSGTSATNCGDRGYSHPLTKRDALVKSIWDESQANYGSTNYAHDKWIYLGLGGNISTRSDGKGDTYGDVENRYAPMIYDRIAAMGKNNVPFYPMGIMLMNNKKGSDYTDSKGTDLKYGFADVCKQILLLNNKYRLQYDPTKPEDYINPNLTGEDDDTDTPDTEDGL